MKDVNLPAKKLAENAARGTTLIKEVSKKLDEFENRLSQIVHDAGVDMDKGGQQVSSLHYESD